MFGEEDSESPRMPSPWEALAAAPTPTLSHCPSPLSLSSMAINVTSDDSGNDSNTDYLGPRGLPAPDLELAHIGSFPRLVPEIEEGNVEYKLKLISPTPQRFTKLVTQLKYRLLEGGGQALYEIGVSDDGQLVGLTRKDLDESLMTLDRMAGELGATVVVLKEIELPELLKETERLRERASAEMAKVKETVKVSKGRNVIPMRMKTTAPLLSPLTATVVTSVESDPPPFVSVSPLDFTGEHLKVQLTTDPATITLPMPIIRAYPYGMKPYALSRNGNDPFETAHSAPSSDDSPSDILSSSDPNTLLPSTSTARTDSDDGAGFGFGFDLEVASSTPASAGLSPLAPSPRIKPSRSKTGGSSFGFVKHTTKSKKPIVIYPSAKPPAERASERRAKRDQYRKERATGVGATGQEGPIEPTPNIRTTPTETINEIKSGLGSGVVPEDEARVIAEALVVRKLAVEEAFLDFHGFGLETQLLSLSGD